MTTDPDDGQPTIATLVTIDHERHRLCIDGDIFRWCLTADGPAITDHGGPARLVTFTIITRDVEIIPAVTP